MNKKPKFRSIRWKLFLAVSFPLFIASFLILGMTFLDLRRAAFDGMNHYMEELATLYAEKFDAYFSEASRTAERTAAFLNKQEVISKETLYGFLRNNVAWNSAVYGSSIAFEQGDSSKGKKIFRPYVYRNTAGINGQLQHGEQDPLREMDLAEGKHDYRRQDWFRLPQQMGTGRWTEPYWGGKDGDTILCTYSAPFFDHGKFRGVATVDVRVEDLQKLVREQGFVLKNSFAIISREGRFIRHPDPKLNMQETIFSAAAKFHRPELMALGRKMMAGEKGAVLIKGFQGAGKAILFYAHIPNTGWSFAAVISENEVMLPVWKKLAKFGLSMIAGFILIVVMLFRLSSKITRPVMDLAAAIPKIGKGDFTVEVKERFGRDELSELTESFNKMAHDLQVHTESLVRETGARQRMEGELQLARSIQLSLFPKALPGAMEFDLFAENQPAYYVAGDFFDFFFADKETFVFSIADVSGKGISAAMFMVMVHTLLRKLAILERPPAEVMDEINHFLLEKNETGTFVTMFLGYYNIRKGTIRYANAGHPQPYCINEEGQLRKFGALTGIPLGISDAFKYGENKEVLKIKETLVLYTDGFPEARTSTGEFLDEERFQTLVKSNSQASARRLGEDLFQSITSFQQKKLADDLTLLVLKRLY